MKYIIKNCPALVFPLKDNPECEINPFYSCKDIQNCLMKQIANKLNTFWCDMVGKSYDLEEAEEIITKKICDMYDLLEIEECEDE